MSIDLKQFHQVFFEESFEGLDVMEQSLLQIQQQGANDPEIINTIFRAAHSIKGGSGTFGFSDIASFTHLLETLLDEVRDNKRMLDDTSIELLLQSTDCLREMVVGHQNEAPKVPDARASLEASFHALLATEAEHPVAAPEQEQPVSEGDSGVWRIDFSPNREILLTGNEPSRIFRELAGLGKLRAFVSDDDLPPLALITPDECFFQWRLWLDSQCEREEIDEVFEWVVDECKLNIERVDRSLWPIDAESIKPVAESEAVESDPEPILTPEPAAVKKSAPAKMVEPLSSNQADSAAVSGDGSAVAASTSIRVGIDKIDSLINLVGELVITQSMLSELGTDFSMDRVERLVNGLEQLMQNTRELQENVMRIRMLPISFAFNRFPRMIRDLSVKMNKKVELKLSGESTELDKTVMEQISDPLVHLVRNAIDHGLETAEERRKAGKPETGLVHLNAYHKGGNIVIEISDDGRGIDAARVLQKAKEKQLIDANADLTETQIYELIFEPGFSTASTVSDISGRGVGMDVVRRNIKSLGGRIEVASNQGKGSMFRIHLPLTLAILDGQLIRVAGETYIVPLVSIVESLQIKIDDVSMVSGGVAIYQLRDEHVPLVPLAKLLGSDAGNANASHLLLVVIEVDGQKMGLLVDDLLAQQQVVIKSLESNYRRVEGFSGATILGDGSVALIIDPAGMLSLVAGQSARKRSAA